jgi:hypothetical protein
MYQTVILMSISCDVVLIVSYRYHDPSKLHRSTSYLSCHIIIWYHIIPLIIDIIEDSSHPMFVLSCLCVVGVVQENPSCWCSTARATFNPISNLFLCYCSCSHANGPCPFSLCFYPDSILLRPCFNSVCTVFRLSRPDIGSRQPSPRSRQPAGVKTNNPRLRQPTWGRDRVETRVWGLNRCRWGRDRCKSGQNSPHFYLWNNTQQHDNFT